MTTEATPPRRVPQSWLDKAGVFTDGGFDGFTPLDWIRQTGASVTSALTAWDQGDLAEAPVGKAWDIVRLHLALGWAAITVMRHAGTPVGPVLHTPHGVEVLVPVGAADHWGLPESGVLTAGTVITVPHPTTVAPRTRRGHSWIVSPHEGGPLTDVDLLYERYAVALASAEKGRTR
ncbi:hypothetical protein [Streptomyces sp. CRN 30]|uniref:hypothetical protein n=1 Tax=Streptomyces sp. CRN 30 TaxID=3075613 RepID=UPI002A80B0DD|nr:hypothetical protein [Streptomyces sp. CRN 30]